MSKGKKIFIIILCLGILILFINLLLEEYFFGDYKVVRQYISSEDKGINYCSNCLWIEFYEGCNKYKTFYFENQHELDKRLKEGMVVNIKFKDGYIIGIYPRKVYLNKCY